MRRYSRSLIRMMRPRWLERFRGVLFRAPRAEHSWTSLARSPLGPLATVVA
jgi:hypothetical protein